VSENFSVRTSFVCFHRVTIFTTFDESISDCKRTTLTCYDYRFDTKVGLFKRGYLVIK